MTWDPTAYLTFDDHRSRPFHDLLARIGARNPRRVVDLGCGPGHLTGLLSARWPDAEIDAFDSSPEMVADARARGVPARQADVRDWHPGERDDVVVTNAVLQWVPGHPRLLVDWIGEMPAGGWFAMQVPGNFDAPSHVLVRELLAEPAWRGRVEVRDALAVETPTTYADSLIAAGAEVDAWETTYLHRLTGEDPVLTWITGTALRPVRAALDDAEWDRFRAELAPRLREVYPAGEDGSTWLPFRRLFMIARTAG
ncbi:trans-aconitate 2-methyltransferase [Pseudonocardia spinosispora]|uniref:trans-aconitate 2-methyltransferase n=1 Tax=Pseudonocardia spinosispora TaxID=103441 RepID=UPI000401E654|nr:trans-aconitate 2-methyltransferase [Pseudonocardia spinosispora]